MIGALQAELLKIRRRPAAWVVGVGAVFLLLFWNYLLEYTYYFLETTGAVQPEIPPSQRLEGMLPGQMIRVVLGSLVLNADALALILGALVSGSEYEWGTVKTVFVLGPARSTVFSGQALALALAVAIIVGMMLMTAAGVGSLIALVENKPIVWPPVRELALAALAAWLILAMWAALGLLLGTLFRNPTMAVGCGLIWIFMLENFINLFSLQFQAIDLLQNWLPWANAVSLVGSFGLRGAPESDVLLMVNGRQYVWMPAVYILVAILLGILTVRSRDVS